MTPNLEGPEIGESRRDEPVAELARLSRSLRAHIEQLVASGAWGVPKEPTASIAAPVVKAAMPRAQVRPEEAASPQAGARFDASVMSPSVGQLPTGHARLEVLAGEARTCTKCALH